MLPFQYMEHFQFDDLEAFPWSLPFCNLIKLTKQLVVNYLLFIIVMHVPAKFQMILIELHFNCFSKFQEITASRTRYRLMKMKTINSPRIGEHYVRIVLVVNNPCKKFARLFMCALTKCRKE